MSRTQDSTSGPSPTVHDNGRTVEPRRPKRRWKPKWGYDRSMRAYEQNPRALGTSSRDLTPFHDDTPLS